MATKTAKRGPKAKSPDGELRDQMLFFRATPDEARRVHAAAAAVGKRPSQFVRDFIMEALS